VIKDAKGTVDLWSEPGRGTRLTIHLPACPQQEKSVAVRDRPQAPRPDTRILVVDDNHDIAQVAARVLSAAGYEAAVLTSRQDALAALSRAPVALILADVVMPGMNLRDFVAAIRRTGNDTRVLLMSGYPAHQHEEAENHPGQLPIIAKPFDTTQLLHDVHACLR
jgi:DNA-binding NtrC family response regulator